MQDPLIGKQLGNYRLDSVIGRGGMATVYYAWDTSLHRPVALKLIDARHRDNPLYAQRFIQEARAVATWHHPNITQVYYADHEDGLYYFAMEFVDGGDLGKLMTQYAEDGELMAHADLLRIGRAIASALDYAHERQVIHRDIKPSNIIIARDGRIALTDFGLALHLSQGTGGESFGSPHYIAPEQASSSALAAPQSDLYSLGVLLYENLTGSLPFDDPQPAVLALKHITDSPPLPRDLNPTLSEATEKVLLKALAKEPSERYQSGAALLDALAEALAQPAAAARPSDGAVALPPLPALRQIAPRAISTRSVADRVSLYLPPPPPDSPTLLPPPENLFAPPGKDHRWTRPAAAVTLMALFALLIWGGWSVWASGNGGGNGNEVPLAAESPPPLLVERPSATPTVAPPITISSPTPSPISPEPEPPTPVLIMETVVVVVTVTASATPAGSGPLPTPTVLYPDGRRLEIWYNEDSFYLHNPGNLRVQLTFLTFEALDGTGRPLEYQFEGWRWAQYYQFLEPGGCVRLEVMQGARYIRPPLCEIYNSSVTPTEDDPEIFWLSRVGAAQFRAVWRQEEVARCAVPGGFCEIYLP